MLKKLTALFMALVMIISMSTNVYAVTGSTVAADGSYRGYSSEGTVTVTVSNGKITDVTANVKSKYQSYISSAFSSVIGQAATADNIDAVSAATKHISAIKSGAKSAIESAPSADGIESGESGGSGSGSESGGSTTDTSEFTITVGGTQELSVSEDPNYSYTWTSSDETKVTVSGNGATATVTGVSVTESPVTVTCTYSFMFLSMTKTYYFTVVSGDNEEIGQGIGEKIGTKYTGKAYVNGDEEDEWVELDVYVDNGRITGVFIAAEDGHWLNLLTTVQDSFLGTDATKTAVDAVTSATAKGFRDTLRNAISDALADAEDEEENPAAPVPGADDGGSGSAETSDTSTPPHVKSYNDTDGNISLSVTGKDVITTTTTTTPGQTTTRGANLVMVIDISGSIEGKEEALNNAVQSLAGSLPSNSQVGVVTFSDYYNSSADIQKIYTADTISGLSFSHINGAGTELSRGITAAKTLLNDTAKWQNPDNDKVMVIISDGIVEDPDNTMSAANASLKQSVKIYSINVATQTITVPDTNTSNVYWPATYGNNTTSEYGMAILQAVSSNYPDAAVTSVGFVYNTISYGSPNPDGKSYVFGTDGADWSNIFTRIIESEGITTTTTATVHTKGVVIKDTLSAYVDLADTNASDQYGITVTADDNSSVPTFEASYDESTREATVTFASDFELTEGVTYTVNIPVKANAAAQDAANASSGSSVDLPTNNGASLTYQYGDGDPSSADYAEEPTINIIREIDDEGDAGVSLNKTAEKVDGTEDEFEITLTIDTTETATSATFQNAIGTYMATADIFYGSSNPYKNESALAYTDGAGNVINGCLIDTSDSSYTATISGNVYDHLPEEKLDILSTEQSGGSKEVTYNFINSGGVKIASVKLYSGMNNYHAYVRLDETHFLSIGHGIRRGGTVNISLTDATLDYLMKTIYETKTVTTGSAVTLNSVTDIMGEYVEYVDDSAAAKGGTVDIAGKTLKWDPITINPDAVSVATTVTENNTTTTTIVTTNAAVLNYRVKVSTDKDGFKYSKEYDANERAVLNYTVNDEDKEKSFPVPTVSVEGYFYVYHTGIANTDNGAVEKINMADSLKSDGTYDLTQHLTAGTLYGGYYLKDGIETIPEDGAKYDGVNWKFEDAQTESGLAVHAEAGETYYVKEVPVTYLVPSSYIIYDKSEKSADGRGLKVRTLFLMTAVDDGNYKSVGIAIKARNKKVKSNDFSDVATVEEFVIRKLGNDYAALTAESMFGVPGGCLGIENATDSLLVDQAIFTSVPYWITPDGLKVTAARQYTQRIGDGYYYDGWKSPGIRKSLTGIASDISAYDITTNAAAGFAVSRLVKVTANRTNMFAEVCAKQTKRRIDGKITLFAAYAVR